MTREELNKILVEDHFQLISEHNISELYSIEY